MFSFKTTSGQAVLQGTPDDVTKYTYLAPLTNEKVFNVADTCALGDYLGTAINIFLGIIAVLAMIMIIMGGLEYMTTELVSEKSAGKEKIQNAILGIVLALGAWLILNTINPKLLEVCLFN